MNIRVYSAIGWLLICGLVTGCTQTIRTAEKAPTPVKVDRVESYSAPSGSRYSATIVPGSQVELAFSVGGYMDKILQVRGPDGRLRTLQQGDLVSRGLILANVRTKDYAV